MDQWSSRHRAKSPCISESVLLELKKAIRSSKPAIGVSTNGSFLTPFLWRLWTSLWLSLPISWRRATYQLLENIGNRKWGRPPGTAQQLPLGLYIKFGQAEHIKSEALATMFVANHTTIPVPTVLDVVPHIKGAAMIMTALPGDTAGLALHIGELSREVFEDTMRDWLSQLRSLPTPSGDAVSSYTGGQLRCCRVQDERFGPFPTISAFHKYIGVGLLSKAYTKQHRIYFTHGDLHLHNILTRDGRITGLLDWECAGWWPEYWEYTIAMYFHRMSPSWSAAFNSIFPGYGEELEAEMAIWEILD
ncbi:hypothetical protein QCA50_008640 [Cerrena zonata]|uniref:Aminoglycoside phosphotransferase domain-containing protein n=1 Tax=Cerrena zonata TaxID=2478898 RepID=A0AAW0GH05_9APHY